MSDPTDPTSSTYVPPNPREAKRPAGSFARSFMTPVTFLLIGLSVAVAIFSRLGESRGVLAPFFISLHSFDPQAPAATLLPEVLRGGQIWRLLTPVFIHFGPIHLIFNMLMLRDLGGILEQRYRAWRFAGLVVAIALVSNLAQYFFGTWNFGGMSGVLYGLFGYAWVQGRLNPAGLGFTLTQQTIILLMGWFVLCLVGFIPQVANGAHAAGLVTGALISYIVARRTAGDILDRRRDFHEAVEDAETEPLHRCHACGRTEEDAPNLEFRVSNVDAEEYCTEHLPARKA